MVKDVRQGANCPCGGLETAPHCCFPEDLIMTTATKDATLPEIHPATSRKGLTLYNYQAPSCNQRHTGLLAACAWAQRQNRHRLCLLLEPWVAQRLLCSHAALGVSDQQVAHLYERMASTCVHSISSTMSTLCISSSF